MATMSGTICVDRDSSVEEAKTYLSKYSRRGAIDKSTDSDLFQALCDSVDSSNDLLAFAAKEIFSSVNPLGSQACDSVVQAILECLRAQAYREMRSLSVDYSDGVVTLRGEVTTYYYKQVAQESVRRLARIITIVNLVDVRYGEPTSAFRYLDELAANKLGSTL